MKTISNRKEIEQKEVINILKKYNNKNDACNFVRIILVSEHIQDEKIVADLFGKGFDNDRRLDEKKELDGDYPQIQKKRNLGHHVIMSDNNAVKTKVDN